jgi:hypothetical protein
MNDYLRCEGYDIYVDAFGDSFDPNAETYIEATEWLATEDIFEISASFSVFGRCILKGNRATRLKVNGFGSDEFMLFNTGVEANFTTCYLATNATIKGSSGTLRTSYIYCDAGSKAPLINAGLRIVGQPKIVGATAVDPVVVGGLLSIEGGVITTGASATNSVSRAGSLATLSIPGGLTVDKPVHANVLVEGGLIKGPPLTNSYAGTNVFFSVSSHPEQVLLATNAMLIVVTNVSGMSGKHGRLTIYNNGATNDNIAWSTANVRFMGPDGSNTVAAAKAIYVDWRTDGTNCLLSTTTQKN